ncbi:MAG TPA: GNAT family N-acetyltransferase [Cyclobacteriaceae bacterium]|jgi:phosphinothricin acetyltransferase|nr:GNAT family N-acetyltransferase [Cyclobacteriaceae bacterium]
MGVEIVNLSSEHYSAVRKIYESGIATGNATFQTEAPEWNEWDSSHLKNGRIVAVENSEVIGCAALTPVSGRCVYAGVAEVSVYVSASHRGKGIGTLLLDHLISESERNNLWTLQAGIFPENVSSLKIHEKAGFRKIGLREKIGKMKGVWRDTVLLERRSKIVGV